MNDTLLSTHCLQIQIGKRTLCQDLSLEIRSGECWGILGQNGAGKTTLLHTLAGLRAAQGGDIQLQHDSLPHLSRREIARRLGLMAQDASDTFPATVLETALVGRHPYISRWQWESLADHDMAHTALEQVELSGFANRQVSTLSGGERRRLALATLLIQNPPLMLLDEPANHLDLRHQQSMLGLLKQQTLTGHAVLMVLHDINHVMSYCDHVLLLFNDGTTRQGQVDEILHPEVLTELYQYPVTQICNDNVCLFTAN